MKYTLNHRNMMPVLLLGSLAALTSCTGSKNDPAPSSAAEPVETVSEADTDNPEPDVPFDAEGMHFSVRSGFYDAAFHLAVSAPEGSEIFYTLDGSTPDSGSIRYTEPILIGDRSPEENTLSMMKGIAQPLDEETDFLPKAPVDKATVVRAIAVDQNGVQSGVVSNTYFVGYSEKAKYYQDMKIISLITDADCLFDYETGIYMIGKNLMTGKTAGHMIRIRPTISCRVITRRKAETGNG